MSTPDDIASLRAELAQLRTETDRLKRDVSALTQFITIERDDDGKPTNINLRCATILCAHPEHPGRMQILMSATVDGPFLSFYGSNEKGRLILSAEKDAPVIKLLNADLKETVLINADPEHGRGLVAVLENGNPRALMKAAPDAAGVVSCVHDDGQSRVVMRSTEEVGEVMVASMDMQTVIKLTSKSLDGGGTLTVNSPTGKPAVILSYLPGVGGCVLVNDAQGKIAASIPDPDKLPEE